MLDLNNLERNVLRDFMQDGLTELLLGGYFLLIGLSLLGDLSVLIVLAIVFYVPLTRYMKKRFTYPRTGYVQLRAMDAQPLPQILIGSLVLGLVALIVVLILVGVITQPGQWYRWMPIFFGTCMAGLFLGLGLRSRLVRHYVVAALALVMGPLIVLLPLEGKLEHLGLFFATLGLVLLAWGTAIFARFLRQYPRLDEEAGNEPS